MSLLQDIRMSRRPMAGFMAVGAGWGSFAALVPPVKAQIGASDALYGALVLVSSFGALAAMWVAPFALRLLGRYALIIGSLSIALGFLGAGVAQTPVLFTGALLLSAAGSGVADVLANAEISEKEADTGRALMNLNHGVYSVTFAVSSLGMGALRDANWSPASAMCVLTIGIMGITLMMHGGSAAKVADTTSQNGPLNLPHRLVWLGGAVVLAAFLSEAATEGWSALHLERTLSASPFQGAWGPAVFGLSMALGRFSGHAMAGWVSDLTLIRWATLTAGMGLGLVGLAPDVSVAYFGLALAGLGISVVVPLSLARIGSAVADDQRVTAISRAAAMGYAAFFLGPPVMGGIAQMFGLRASFAVIAAFLGVVAIFLVPMFRRSLDQPAK